MDAYNKLIQHLSENNISYEALEHEPAASAEEYQKTLNTRLEQQAKALLLRYKRPGEKGYAVAVLQAQKQIDLEKIKRKLQAAKARLADRNALSEVTGCNFGELHPFASVYGLPLLMDEDLLNEKKIYMNAGCLDHSVVISPEDLKTKEHAILF